MSELAQALEPEFESNPAQLLRSLGAGIGLFAGKWTPGILWYLDQRPRRFGEIASLLPGITPKVLTYQLKDLLDAGLICRTSFVPRQSHYALTEAGRSAMPLVRSIFEWGMWRLREQARG